jgi:hypothetical protein
MVCAAAGLAALHAAAQPVLPPEAIDQLQGAVGNRVETLTILGGDYAAAGGVYTFRGGTLADFSLGKIGGGGAVAAPKPIGVADLKWAPVLQGNLGRGSVDNEFTTGFLQGNRSRYEMTAVQAGGGVRLYFTDNLSISPTLSGIYGSTENEFRPQNAVGDFVKSVASGTYVDWHIKTWSIVPAVEGRYDWLWGRTTVELSSRYTYYHTESYESSSPVVSVDGNSQTWENRLDLDVPLGLKLFDRELHTGGFISRTELEGGVAEGFTQPHFYTANARLVLDFFGHVWPLRWIGVGCSYFWSEKFGGWSAGVDVRLQF